MIKVSIFLVFLSGLTGLIYQVTWQKYLSVMLGSHASAASIVLALFFLFLSLGYAVIGRYSFKIHKNHLAQYGAFEFVIGLYALYSPILFRFIFDFYSAGKSTGDSAYFWGLLLSGLFIFIPTFLMGGTIPVLVQALSSSYEVSSKIHARIYATNTLGAFLGCVLAGFWLIEDLGIEDTLLATGWVNILIGLGVWVIIAKSKSDFSGPEPVATKDKLSGLERWRFAGLVMISFLSGFYIFTLEKLVIRMSGLVYGSSTYTYSIVVGAFILAIGVGSYLLSVFERRLNEKSFIFSLILSAVSLLALYLFIPAWPEVGLRIRVLFQSSLINFMPFWITNLNFALLLFLIPVGLLGTNLPFLFSLIRNQNKYLAQMVGRLYSINCLGATLGAIIGGYWFFKFFSADEVFKISVVLLLVGSAIAVLTLQMSSKFKTFTFLVLAMLFACTLMLPKWSSDSFIPGRYLVSTVPAATTDFAEFKKSKGQEYLYEKYDPNTYVAVTQLGDKDRVLFVNGKPDAATTGDQLTRAMAALTPMALSTRKVKNIFIAGLGAGLSMAVASKFAEVELVEVAEISEGVKETLPLFKEFNFGLETRPEKFNVEVGDAYKVLMSKKRKYDLIICEPSNPWVTGVEKLFSTEFYQQVRDHLYEDGLFAQWFPLFGMNDATFLTILNTYSKEFKWVSVWSAGGGSALTIIGSQKEFSPDFKMVQARFEEQKEIYSYFKVNRPETLLYYQVLTPAQVKLLLLKVDSVNSVFAPILEFKAGRGNFAGLNVDLNTLITAKSFLPFPEILSREIMPLWYEQKIDFNLKAFEDVKAVLGGTQFHLLRQYLLLSDGIQRQSPKDTILPTLKEHFFLMGRESAPKADKKEEFDQQVSKITSKVRQLNAIGLKPKLGQLTRFIEQNCAPENCAKAKYAFLTWTTTPEKWAKIFSLFDIKKLNDEQKKQIDEEYLNVQKIYQSMGAF